MPVNPSNVPIEDPPPDPVTSARNGTDLRLQRQVAEPRRRGPPQAPLEPARIFAVEIAWPA